MSNSPKSLETILDEERKDVLALLEKRPSQKPKGAESSTVPERVFSPFENSQPPVRSMLDIGNASTPMRSPAAGTSTGSTSTPRAVPVRSILDIDSPPLATMSTVKSAKALPAERAVRTGSPHHRSLSDTASRPADMGSRALGFDPASAYKFSGYLPSNPGGPIVPKRNTQAGKKLSNFSSARSSLVNTDTSKLVLTDGSVLDMNSAYHRLSDTNLSLLGNRLSSLSGKIQRRASSGDAIRPDRARLEKDYTPLEGDDGVMESSEEEDRSSDEEGQRGRTKKARDRDDSGCKTLTIDESKGARSTEAEEDDAENTAQKKDKYKVRSLLEPEITVTGPPGDKLKSSKPEIHPNTSFDEGASGFNTPVDSDAEADFTDIKRAQKLSVNMTSIVSTPATSRSVRTIYRGDFAQMQQEARDNQRRVRKYLVATDLSEEAAHALEWTIGTVLRDGDTLLAIYCVDEELGIAPNEPSGDDSQLHAQATVITASAKPPTTIPVLPSVLVPTQLGYAFKLESSSANASPMGRGRGKAEHERYRAVQDITDRVSKLLRKTKLQVKIVIEVIHCKSPKHLITEVIDYISPTLVILGSRGRSALKGVILGSFSNYLVTKSSVPVMVARKRLRKHSKYKRPAIRLANNLAANPAVRSLANAKID